MFNLKFFLTEEASEDKLTHLEHAEDHIINSGAEGFKHTFDNLHNTHEALLGKKTPVTISTKYDGSPSVVFGHHPETGKFFVASKSAFNVTPKLNYTHDDIEKNHGHAPGLVNKLKAALTHLPKVAPKRGIFQGDFMYNKEDKDVTTKGNEYHFKPNTINYSAKKTSEHGQQIAKAKMGFVVHTAYHGDTLRDQKAQYNADTSHFNSHPDVHLISAHTDLKKVHYPLDAQQEYKQHMQHAIESHGKIKSYDHLDKHRDHLKTYINSTVRDEKTPTISDYKKHITKHFTKKQDQLKTPAGKQRQQDVMQQHLDHVEKHSADLKNILKTHKHLQMAKDVLVRTLSSHQDFHHSVNGTHVKPEGFVSVINNRPTKLVDRNEFSKLNFLARPR